MNTPYIKYQPVTETNKAHFWDMLEVLPPKEWINDSDGESFKMSERLHGNITDIFARIGNRYFTLTDDFRTPHSEIMRRCKKFMLHYEHTMNKDRIHNDGLQENCTICSLKMKGIK